MKLKYLSSLLLSTLLIAGCERQVKHHYRPLMAEKETVKVYKVHRTNSVPVKTIINGVSNAAEAVSHASDATDNSWLYWYIIYDNNTRSYYSASSTTPTTSYSSLSWSEGKAAPTIANSEEEVVPVETTEVNTSDLGQAATEISSDYSSIPEVNSLDSMEGVPESGSESSDSSSSSSDSSSGGDSGGGDGGGD